MPLPPDRSRLATEQRHERSRDLDALAIDQCIDLMIDDHQAVMTAIRAARPALTRFIDDLVPRMRESGRLIYIGAGTSGRLGVLDASECPPTFCSDPSQVIGIIAGGDAALRRSSESREDDPQGAAPELATLKLTSRDTLVGIAAGGTTPYVLGAIEIAKSFGTATGLLTCVHMPVPRECDHLIVLDTGAELLTGSTRLKAGSATKLALNIITTNVFIQLGKVYSNLMVDLRATNAKLMDRALRIVTTLCPELSREDAAALLDHADRQVKTAIVMHRLDVDSATAVRLLDGNAGSLRRVLEPATRRT